MESPGIIEQTCTSATLADLCAATGARQAACGFATLANPANVPLGPIVSDSRVITPGDVFWALRGPNHRGEDFLDEAFSRGAAGAIVGDGAPPFASSIPCHSDALVPNSPHPNPLPTGEPTFAKGCWAVQVNDTHRALNDWARWRRKQFTGTMIGVTGSAGKSTTREMIHCVLRTSLRGTASPRNFNNHFGVPLSMTAIEPHNDYAVLEMGASAPGEIAALADLARPQVGVITCVGDAHLAGFGSREAIAAAKAELLQALPPNGRAVFGDDPWLRTVAAKSPAEITWVGLGEDCHLRATDICHVNGRLTFRVEKCQFSLPVCGRHHVTAVLVSLAVGEMLGIDLDAMARSLYKFRPLPMRCQVEEIDGVSVINDAYNSNPTAMRAALEMLREFRSPCRRIVVTGDMAELGEHSAALHREVGEQVVEVAGAKLLVACGQFAKYVASGARAAGMSAREVVAFDSVDAALPYLQTATMPGDVVLVKGSRVMGMERAAETLLVRRRRHAA